MKEFVPLSTLGIELDHITDEIIARPPTATAAEQLEMPAGPRCSSSARLPSRPTGASSKSWRCSCRETGTNSCTPQNWTSPPSGRSEIGTILKFATHDGNPMIVRHRSAPVTMCPIASQIPAAGRSRDDGSCESAG